VTPCGLLKGQIHVPVLIPKNTTNLKMRLKTQCITVLPILTFGKYTVGDTLVGRTVLKLNSGPGRLARGGWLDSDSEGEARSISKLGTTYDDIRK
jgi:hypothetical protein